MNISDLNFITTFALNETLALNKKVDVKTKAEQKLLADPDKSQ